MSSFAGFHRLWARLAACAALCLLAGCAADSASRDWSWWNNNTVRLDPLTPGAAPPDALVNPDGSCAGAGTAAGGVALGMTECDLVRLAGAGAEVRIGANARGGREAVITYRQGDRPGVYRFEDGRLSEIERAPEPAAKPNPQRATKPKQRQSALQTVSAS